MSNMYIPKKLKWDTLGSFKRYLEKETKEKIVRYNGYELITETTEYGIVDDQLNCRPVSVKEETKQETPIRNKPAISKANEKRLAKTAPIKKDIKKPVKKKVAIKKKVVPKKKAPVKKKATKKKPKKIA